MSEIIKEAWRNYPLQLQLHPLKTKLYGFAYSGLFGHFLNKLMDILFRGKKGNKIVAKKHVKKNRNKVAHLVAKKSLENSNLRIHGIRPERYTGSNS